MADQDNNFKQMLSSELEKMPDAPLGVENSLDGTMGIIDHFANVVELYIPNFFQAVVAFLGGANKTDK